MNVKVAALGIIVLALAACDEQMTATPTSDPQPTYEKTSKGGCPSGSELVVLSIGPSVCRPL